MYVVFYIPEQCEEIYEVLVDGTTIASVELPRKSVDGSIVFESWALDDYLKRKGRLSKLSRRRLNFAIELANEHRAEKVTGLLRPRRGELIRGTRNPALA
jgi:hypothetical protein